MISSRTIACVYVAICVATGVVNAQTIRTVALSGRPAPGTPFGTSFQYFFPSGINSQGEVTLYGSLTGLDVDDTNERGLWIDDGAGNLELLVRSGDPVPGLEPEVEFSHFLNVIGNRGGKQLFFATLTGTNINETNKRGIWERNGNGDLSPIARTGSNAPGTGTQFAYFDFPLLNRNGDIAFLGYLPTIGGSQRDNSGIWSRVGDGTLGLIAHTGDYAPGTANDVAFGAFGTRLVLNDAGQTAFWAYLDGPNVNSTNDQGIWSETGSNGLALVARTGEQAPGIGGGVTFSSLEDPSIDNQGNTVFRGVLSGVSVNSANDVGIWNHSSEGTLELIVRAGNPAPGTESGTSFGRRLSRPSKSSVGHLAFSGDLIGPEVLDTNDQGLWSSVGGELNLIARSGDPAPETEQGVVFESLPNPMLNANGQIVGMFRLAGTGVDNTNDFGIWAQDLTGNLRKIVRKGDLIDVDEGLGTDLRTIADIRIIQETSDVRSTEEGYDAVLNDAGQVAFHVLFSDWSEGIFVSNLVAIPEPSTGVFASVGLLWTAGVRRMRD